MNNALYVHIPFCACICTYCDFYKMIAKDKLKEKYIDYLVKEIEMKKVQFSQIKTIYIGGGTPSCLNLNLLDFLLFHLEKNLDINLISEFTIEANPNDINLKLIEVLKKYHINRISLGVQSFNLDRLKVLGRTHNEEDVKKAMKLLIDPP